MDLLSLPLVWGQADPAAPNLDVAFLLALRRWFSSLTLSAPQSGHALHALPVFLAGLLCLLALAVTFQGPGAALKQLFNLPAHVELVRAATRRVWRAGRVVSIAIGFTVLSWTAAEAVVFLKQDTRRFDPTVLTKARGLGEVALEQGFFAGLTPLRDVAGLGDNLALLLVAAILAFRASLEPPVAIIPPDPAAELEPFRPPQKSMWWFLVWGSASLCVLYRAVGWTAGSGDLPLGGCLTAEAFLIPAVLLISDGFLLAWLLSELRNAGFESTGEDRLDTKQAVALMPGAALACALALPARYVATFVWLSSAYLPTWVHETSWGGYVRWQLGWGLTDLQGASLVGLGIAGAVAWSRGTIRGAVAGYRRLLASQGGYLVAAVLMAGTAAGLLAAAVYSIVLLLPSQSWVLFAADSYAHYATLPVGLWTLAALIELGERSLPVARVARSKADETSEPHDPAIEDPEDQPAQPVAAAPAS
jgi:hypothetical protein